tara:strand:+ start:378 stop:647 length:270 start_codon:yes stop_codon:yes gene_type:complete
MRETMMKIRIHVNQHIIRANAKNGRNDPTLTAKTYKHNYKVHEVDLQVSSEVKYQPEKPLSCGAKVWIEAEAQEIALTSIRERKILRVL